MTIHPLADVKSNNIGEGTTVWQFAIILQGAKIGKDCNINCHTFIENNVIIGDRVTVKAGVFIWDEIEIGDDVFIGSNVTFVNDKFPRSKKYPGKFETIKVMNGASIGANATILGNITIGEYAMVGAGSVVTKDILPYALVYGNPARHRGNVDNMGNTVEKLL